MTKSEIRNSVKAEKSKLTKTEVHDYSDRVQGIFLESDLYRDATVIYSYLPYNTEIETQKIIECAWRDGKKVCVPKVLDDGYMEFYEITSFDTVKLGYCGIPEPEAGEVSQDRDVLLIMPGLAFDKRHNRVGYGGGFYDRYIDRRNDCTFTTVAFAYEFQVFEKLETEAHDKKVDYLITKEGLI